MGQPKLAGKRTLTLNLVESDVELARLFAAARNVSTASVIRDAVRVGLPSLIERELDLLDAESAKQLRRAVSKPLTALPKVGCRTATTE